MKVSTTILPFPSCKTADSIWFAGPCLKSMKLVSTFGTRIGGACKERFWGQSGSYSLCMVQTCASGMDAFLMINNLKCFMLECSGPVSMWPCDYGFDQSCGRAFVKIQFIWNQSANVYQSMLIWILTGAPLKANGAPGNIQNNLTLNETVASSFHNALNTVVIFRNL